MPIFDTVKALPWARRTKAKIAVRTEALGPGELLTDEAGGLYVGDGTTSVKDLQKLIRQVDIQASLTSADVSASKGALSDRLVFVSRNGNDANDGLSLGKSFATLAAAITALGSTGGRIQMGGGTFNVASTIVRTASDPMIKIDGCGPNSTVINFTAANTTFLDLTNVSGKLFMENLRITHAGTATGSTLISLTNCFRNSFDNVWWTGQHVSASVETFKTQVGIKFSGNSGDNFFTNNHINNLGVGCLTDAIMNYFIGGMFGSCWNSIAGGDPAGAGNQAGITCLGTGFVGAPGGTVTDRHVWIKGSANLWWFLGCWAEGARICTEVGSTSYGPFGFTWHGGKMAGSTTTLVINRARQPLLDGVTLDADSGYSSAVRCVVDAGQVEGTAINVIDTSQYDGSAAFPKGWTVLGRGVAKMPTTTFPSDNNVFTGGVPNAQGVAAGFYPGVLTGTPRAVWSDGTNVWAVDVMGGNRWRVFRPGSGEVFGLDIDGNLLIGGPTGVNTGGVKKGLALPYGTAPTGTPTNTAVLWADAAGLKYKIGSGAVTTIGAAASGGAAPNFPFVPAAVGRWYPSPLVSAVRSSAATLNRVALHAFYSGSDGLTIDQLDVMVNTVGAAGSITRCGVYSITDQARPFTWTPGSAWATLLSEFGTTDNTATGQRTVTAGTALAIPANTWFAVGGVEQVAASTRNVGGSAGQTMFSPFGQATQTGVGGYAALPGLALYVDSVTGALPATFTPVGSVQLDSGVGLRRSV